MPNFFSTSLSCRNWSPNYSVLVSLLSNMKYISQKKVESVDLYYTGCPKSPDVVLQGRITRTPVTTGMTMPAKAKVLQHFLLHMFEHARDCVCVCTTNSK
jgi:hypothetical protein